jgi:hypothetical protein
MGAIAELWANDETAESEKHHEHQSYLPLLVRQKKCKSPMLPSTAVGLQAKINGVLRELVVVFLRG